MKKLLILFLFIGMVLCFWEGSSRGEGATTAPFSQTGSVPESFPAPPTLAPISAIIVQCPYCHAAYTVYGTGIFRCSTCGSYFQVVPSGGAASAATTVAPQSPVIVQSPVVITPPPVVYTPPPVYYYPYYHYPYYPGWYGPGFSLSFRFGGHGHFEHGHEHGGGHHK